MLIFRIHRYYTRTLGLVGCVVYSVLVDGDDVMKSKTLDTQSCKLFLKGYEV